MKRNILCLMAIASLSLSAFAQENKEERSAFWGNQGAYLEKQEAQILDLVDEALTLNPPTTENSLVRKLALFNLDGILHETKYDKSDALFSFMESRVNKVLQDLNTVPTSGMKVYKLYNDGFIAKTKSVGIAFDLVRGDCGGKKLISDELVQKLVDQCDVLFLSHNHGDHVDAVVVDMFIKAGKPVVATETILDGKEGVTHFRSDKMLKEKIKLANGKKLEVRIFPGHQDDMPNNIHVVMTPEGLSVAQVGDQYNKDDMVWIADAKKQIKPLDILIVNCWTHKMADLIAGFAPKVVVSGHENEMAHTIDHREAFWLTFQKMKSITTPYVVMAWGEGYDYSK